MQTYTCADERQKISTENSTRKRASFFSPWLLNYSAIKEKKNNLFSHSLYFLSFHFPSFSESLLVVSSTNQSVYVFLSRKINDWVLYPETEGAILLEGQFYFRSLTPEQPSKLFVCLWHLVPTLWPVKSLIETLSLCKSNMNEIENKRKSL